jgi:lipooligosaccharide transport system ATP-binding protein
VLLTTHYMEEAERLCDRLVILAEGRVVADGAPRALIRERLAPEALELEVAPADERRVLGDLDGVQRLRSGRRLMVYVPDAAALLETIRHREGGRACDPGSVIVRPTNLEDVFLALTGTRIEAGEAGEADPGEGKGAGA